MSSLKEIRRRISSVNSTKQITRAMKLVSAAKLRRAQDAAESGRAYRDRLGNIVRSAINDLSGEFSHPLLNQSREVTTRRVIFVSGDRGLCGGYNSNVIKAIEAHESSAGVELEYVAIGRRSVATANRMGWKTVAEYDGLPEDATQWPVEEIGHNVIKDFEAGKCQQVVLYYTKFVSALTQEVTRQELLPFTGVDLGADDAVESEGVLSYSPSPERILESLVPMLVKVSIAQAGLESKASEHAARMTAMDAATNNASDLIDKLRLYYNRARQSAITTELIDIIGGSEAAQ